MVGAGCHGEFQQRSKC